MKRLVLYILEDENNLQFKYRVRNVKEILDGSDKWEVKYVLRSKINKLDLTKVSLIVIERQTAKNNQLLHFIHEAHGFGIKVLFDVDDLIFDYRDLRLVSKTVEEKNIFYWLGYFWGIRRVAKRVDGFITTNEFLARKLKRSFGKSVKVIRNSLNREQISISDKLVKEKNKKSNDFVVGYFSGTLTHGKDFQMVEPELIRFLTKYDAAILEVVGEMKFSGKMKKWIEKGRVKVLDKVDYLKLQELICGVDVNIAPLLINDFTNCKSELKFFEAAVVETTTIASPTYTFKKVISDGKNGFLARPNEWYEKLEYLYKNPEKNHKVALEAKKYVLKHYYGKEFLKEVEEAYDYFAK